jgi:exo-1,4-beta-D-glucosaminidase
MNLEIKKWQLSYGTDGYLGENVSVKAFDDTKWHSVTTPSSVVSQLVEAGEFENPYYNLNMKKLDGYKHGRDLHFAFYPMPDDSPFRKPIWYRTVISLDKKESHSRYWLKFDGLNYKANIWLNGKRVAGDSHCAGTYRQYDIDVTRFIKKGVDNVLAVELFAQKPDELGMTFIDWSPVPPDDSAGIWQPVTLYTTESISAKKIDITTETTENLGSTKVIVKADLTNFSTKSSSCSVKATITGDEVNNLEKEFSLEAFEESLVEFSQEIISPKLWWPYTMGEPYLYTLKLELIDESGEVAQMEEQKFGVRRFESEINEFGSRLFLINGKEILIRGTAWSPDLLLRQSSEQDEMDIAYLKEMNLNTVRLEGKLATDEFWDICDREGVLVMAGWPCCTHWEKWDKWKPDDYTVAKESLKSQIYRLRNRPSFLAWFYGSDYPPIPPVEKMYLKVLNSLAPDLIHLSSASQYESTITGKTGVKMSGPYGYVPPIYWYDDSMPGVAKSFNTETGPDSSFPRYESVLKMLSPTEQKVGSDGWNHHAGLASFTDTEVMNSALEKRYGADRNSLKEFLEISQISAYEAWRAMYEAYGRNFPKATGVIGWMQNGHWPSLIWQKYDWLMVPTGGFYGTKKACEPVHVQYSYDDNSIWIINESGEEISGSVLVSLFSEKGKSSFEKRVDFNCPSFSRVSVTEVELPQKELFFLNLRAEDSSNKLLSQNFYWLSSQKEELEDKGSKKTWFYRPITKADNFSALKSLPEPKLSFEIEKINEKKLQIDINSKSDHIAFGVQLDIITENGDIKAPIFWSDNLLFLTPNENRLIEVELPSGFDKGDRFRAVSFKGQETILEIK